MTIPRPAFLVLLALALARPAGADGPQSLRLVQTIPLPDVAGRIDHFVVDPASQRMFLAALEKNALEVVDLKAGRPERSLPGFLKPQGVLFVPRHNRLFVACGKDGACKILDGATLEVVRTVTVSLGADALGYDPETDEVYIGSGGGDAGKDYGDLTIVQASDGSPVAALHTDAHAGGTLVDPTGNRVFVEVPEKSEVVVLDRRSHAQLAKWKIPGIEKDVAQAFDPAGHRLMLGVRTPASVVVLDSDSGAVVATAPTVGILDGLSYDAARHRIYTTGGEGFLDVTEQTDRDHYRRIERIPTGPIARTSYFVPEWNRLYVAVPRAKDRSAEIRIFETQP